MNNCQHIAFFFSYKYLTSNAKSINSTCGKVIIYQYIQQTININNKNRDCKGIEGLNVCFGDI